MSIFQSATYWIWRIRGRNLTLGCIPFSQRLGKGYGWRHPGVYRRRQCSIDTDKEGQTSEGWKTMGEWGKSIKEPVASNLVNMQETPSKKRTLASSILDDNIWKTLALPFIPPEGEIKLQIWPVIYTTGPLGRVYHNILLGELMCMQVLSSPTP